MKNYNALLAEIMSRGVDRTGRNGTTKGLFSPQLRYDLAEGFPAVTTKELKFNFVAAELFWFMSGSSDNNILEKLGCPIWKANAHAPYWLERGKAKFPGDLGRIYGVQWRTWKRPDGTTVDQLKDVIERIKRDPYDRRLIVTAWNPGELDEMALPPCHMTFQFYVADGKLSLHMLQRSCDMFLGVPFNIASYALLVHLVAQFNGLKVGELVLTLVDAHIYDIHYDAVRTQLSRTPHKLPTLWLNPDLMSLDDVDVSKLNGPEDIAKWVKLVDYQHDPAIKAPMAV